MILPVARAEPALPEEAVPASLEERPGKLQVPRLARRPVELDERHLDLGMAVDERAAARPEPGIDQVHRSLDNPQQPVVPGSAVPRDGCLHQVPERVELVTPLEVGELLPRLAHLEVAVQVPVVALRCGQEVDDGICSGREVAVRPLTQLPADGLEPLVHVGVEEWEGRPTVITAAAVRAVDESGSQPEIPQIAGPLELGACVRDRDPPAHVPALRPEPGLHVDGVKVEWPQPNRGTVRGDDRRHRRPHAFDVERKRHAAQPLNRSQPACCGVGCTPVSL